MRNGIKIILSNSDKFLFKSFKFKSNRQYLIVDEFFYAELYGFINLVYTKFICAYLLAYLMIMEGINNEHNATVMQVFIAEILNLEINMFTNKCEKQNMFFLLMNL